MSRFPRTFIKHEQPRSFNPDKTIGIYCRNCGREIIRVAQSTVRSVTKCQICLLKEQGVLNPEDAVLPQYILSSDHNRIPVPIEAGQDDLQAGVLMLYPEMALEETGQIPQSGGFVGTVRSMFRAFGFIKPKTKKQADNEAIATTPSLAVARSKRHKGLFEE
jgi:hypothetical protein